jgi:hypothetical protein
MLKLHVSEGCDGRGGRDGVAVVGIRAGFAFDVSFIDMTQVRSAVCCARRSRCLVAVCCEGQVFTYVCVVVHVV